jgi:hypothetical protein
VHDQRLVSVVKRVTVLEESTTEEQRSVMHFLGASQKDSMQRILIEKCFLCMVRSVCHVKQFTTGSGISLKDI